MFKRVMLRIRIRRAKKERERLLWEIEDWSYDIQELHAESFERYTYDQVRDLLVRQLTAISTKIHKLEEELRNC